MSLVYSGAEPQPSLAWTFESSNVDYVTNLQPSAQVSPGPAQLAGSAALVTNAPTSNTAVYFPGGGGTSYMTLNDGNPAAVDIRTSNLFVECWVYQLAATSGQQGFIGSSRYSQQWVFHMLNSYPHLWIYGPVSSDFGNTVPVTTWTHVAFSWALGPTSNTICGFVNGVESYKTTSTTPVSGTPGTAVIGICNNDIFNGYIRDLRVVQGGVVPTTSFTPGSAPFSYTLPSYVTGSGSVVFTLLGQFVTYPAGKYGTSIYFNNKNATASGTANASTTYNISSSSITANNASYSVWIKPYYAFPVSGLGQTAFRFTDSQTVYELDFNSGVNQSQLFFYASSTPGVTITTGVNLTTQTWYHYSVVLSNVNMTASNTSVAFYFNGTQYGATSNVARTGISLIQTVVLAAGGAGGSNGFWGELDDLRIYNTALTAAQVQSVYSSQGAPAPSRAMPLPKYAWDFQSSNVDYVSSLSPGFSTTAGALTAAPTYTAGKYGQAINFPNNVTNATANSYIRYSLSIPIANFSIAFWMNPAQLPASSGGQSYVTIFDGSANYFTFYNNANGNWAALFGQNPYTVPVNIGIQNTGLIIPQNAWSHMAATFINGTVAFYFNGGLVGTATFANTWTVSQLNVGNYWNTASGFNGSIDDLRIFDRALTSAQVQAIYNQQGVPGRGASGLSLPLDKVSGQVSGAYSTRLIRSAYTGPVVRVRRNSDSTQLDFISDVTGNLSNVSSAVSIASWLSATTGNSVRSFLASTPGTTSPRT